jgi:hypothetical protein
MVLEEELTQRECKSVWVFGRKLNKVRVRKIRIEYK